MLEMLRGGMATKRWGTPGLGSFQKPMEGLKVQNKK